jgi:phosphoenolpyruvate carboxykinase (GTP)
VESPLGWVPRFRDMDWRGSKFTEKDFNELMDYDHERMIMNTINDEKLFLKLHHGFPQQLVAERQLLIARL